MRTAEIKRTSTETDISIKLNIDGKGEYSVNTGCEFFDHMLSLFAKLELEYITRLSSCGNADRKSVV